MNKILLTIILAVVIVGAVTAGILLYPYNPDNPPSTDDTQATPEGIQEVVNANNQFAFELYSELNTGENKDKNVFYSPYSISTALAMTYEGAKGTTADEMKSVFHFPESNLLKPNFAAIYNKLNKEDKAYQLKTGNALWVQEDYPLLEDYTSRVENYYGGKAQNLDFKNNPVESSQTINSFIEEQTNNKIKNLISPDIITPLTRLILTNAIYFKGTWEWQFDKSDTSQEDFKITPENVVKTDMMYMDPDKARFNYVDTGDLQILEMPYKGDEISMLVILPKQGEDYNFETGEEIIYNNTLEDMDLTTENLNEWKAQMKETKLDAIYFPKFEFDTKYFMKETLSALGMPTAFDDKKADFSGMTEEEKLYIGFVIHQAYVKVDEEGTEAAAATAVGMGVTSAGPRNIFRADHPFIFIIQEKATGNILFLGKVVDPR